MLFLLMENVNLIYFEIKHNDQLIMWVFIYSLDYCITNTQFALFDFIADIPLQMHLIPRLVFKSSLHLNG